MTILLVFCYFVGLSATADTNSLPESVVELLSGKTTDFTGVANQIPEHQLPTALAAAKLLKFRALHGETSLSSNEAEAFETILLDRMSTSRQVAFSQNETCRKKVEQREIMFDGQKLLVPTHFVANTDLAIIDCRPKGEAGSLFPDFNIEVFSQSPLTEMTLAINGQAVNTRNILINQSANTFELSYRTPATPDSFLSIGTHTAEITINNQSGETVKQQWSFTVGCYDVPTPPLPADVKIISEIALPGDKLLPGQKLSGSLRAVIYEDTAGNRYIEYQLTTPSGKTIKSRNLAFIGRKMLSDRNNSDELTLSPQTDYAFIGNTLNFAYFWSGVGEVLSENWQITSGSLSTSETSIKMAGGTLAKCTVVVESTYPGSDGNQIPYQYEVTATKTIYAITLFTTIFSNRMLLISNDTACAFELSGDVGCSVKGNLVEGAQYPFGDNNGAPTASLRVNRLRWKIHAGEGSPTIESPVATSTKLVFGKHGFAEMVFDVKLTWQHAGEIYESNFEPTSSGLYAFYPVTGKAEFTSFPLGQLSVGRRRLSLKSFEFEIKGQKRLITSPDDFELAEPLVVSSSSIWPASSPVIVTKAIPVLRNGPSGALLKQLSPFTFLTPMMPDAGLMPLSLNGVFYAGEHDNRPSRTFISNLPSIPVYSDQDVLQLQLNPAEPVVMFEGVETEFSAQVAPVLGMGQGLLSEVDKSLDILNGYKVSSVEYIHWFEEPLGDEGDWPSPPVKKGADFTHIFEPWLGPGSYTMNCGIVMNLQESDTGEEVPIHLESSVPVDVLPGLRIFSPINDLAYPLNASLKVKTSFDKDPEIWKTITWYLNGKLYKHGLNEAPFFLELNRTGKWSLVASLTIENPQGGEPISLQDRVDFIVNPVEISLTPARKVLDFSSQQSQELSLNITLNGKQIEKPGESVEWSDDGLKAVADPIEWFSATAPNGCAIVNHDEDNLTANVNFADAGAATVLATITVRLTDGEEYFRRRHKGFKDEFEEPIFTFPAVRADLWAVSAGKIENIEGHIPRYAITNTYRTWQIDSFSFEFNNNRHFWNTTNGIKPDLLLKPAIGGIPSPTGTMLFNWNADGDTPPPQPPNPTARDERRFIFQPDADGNYTIKLITQIDFAIPDKLNLPEIPFSLESLPFEKFIDAKITPISFLIMTDESQLLQYSYEYLFGVEKDYKITLQDVVWSKPSGEIGNGQEFTFSYSEPVAFMLIGSGLFKAQEKFVEPPPATDFTVKRECYAEVRLPPTINLTAYDLSHVSNPIPEDLEETPGALIHFNIDNDNRNVAEGQNPDFGWPIPDWSEEGFVENEDDLTKLTINLDYVPNRGTVVLWLENDSLKLWTSPQKGTDSLFLTSEKEKRWSLSDPIQKEEFEKVRKNLWVEGCGSSSAYILASYLSNIRDISSDKVNYNFLAALSGRQPNNAEHKYAKDWLPSLIDCEWSVTGDLSTAYNCIAHSVSEYDVAYIWRIPKPGDPDFASYTPRFDKEVDIDDLYGNVSNTQEPEDIEMFYDKKGFVKLAESDKEAANVIFYSRFHAARKSYKSATGKYFFESKLGQAFVIQHFPEQLSGNAFGYEVLWFKKRTGDRDE